MVNQGWECPKCGRVFAPFVSECNYCGKYSTITVTSPNTNPDTTVPSIQDWEKLIRKQEIYVGDPPGWSGTWCSTSVSGVSSITTAKNNDLCTPTVLTSW